LVKYKTSTLSYNRFAKEAQAFKETSFSKATMVMRFPAKKNGRPKAPHQFPPRKDGILYPPRVVLGLPSPSRRVCAVGRTYVRTDGRSREYYVTNKIFHIDRLPNLLSNGAFARRLRYHRFSYNSVIPIALGGIVVEISAEQTCPFDILPALQSVWFI